MLNFAICYFVRFAADFYLLGLNLTHKAFANQLY